ncbi:hypothetical protein LINPERHAP2_LOCUS29895 [Linum perenne]
MPLPHIFFADDLIILGEASTKQASSIQDCLEEFSRVSGQVVSREKSKSYFSKNVSTILRSSIVDILGMLETRNLGQYLGIMLLHGRVTNAHYSIFWRIWMISCQDGKATPFLWLEG